MRQSLKFILPIAGILAFFAAYTVYWFMSASRVETEVAAWIDRHRAAGYEVSYESLTVRGYPYRFQIELDAPVVVAPLSDGGWRADIDFVQANALPYDFSHWIVSFAGPMHLAERSGETLEVDAAEARISVITNRNGETERLGAEMRAVTFLGLDGATPQISRIDSLLMASDVVENTMRVRIQADGVHAASAELGPALAGAFGETAALARMDLAITEWTTLARGGDTATWSRVGGRVQIAEAELDWGPARITGEGDFTLDDQARPDGRLSVHISDPDALADALVDGGLISAEHQDALRLATMLAPRGPEGVSLPFNMRDGSVYLGPVRLGGLD